jgi:hypothetical protein
MKILKNRTVIITGVGRSGTTILGKVVGSMTPCFYLFEPALLKFIREFPLSETFGRILFEDYLLPLVHGRGNMNPNDWSCMKEYESEVSIIIRQEYLKRRSDAIRYIQKNEPRWIIKSNEFQHLFDNSDFHFPGCRYIHIIRNGYDVVDSSLRRGWYTDDYCNSDIVEFSYSDFDVAVPIFILDDKDRYNWSSWNPATRAACAWRHLTTEGIKRKNAAPDSMFQFRYEDFCKRPREYATKIATWTGMKLTPLTLSHIKSIKNTTRTFKTLDIHQPELDKFTRLNEKLGYC